MGKWKWTAVLWASLNLCNCLVRTRDANCVCFSHRHGGWRWRRPSIRISAWDAFRMQRERSTEPNANTQRVLWAEGLTKCYNGKDFQFKDISFTLCKGQRVGLIGINGAGKSTLLKALAGLDKADKGTVYTQSLCNIVYAEQDPPVRSLKVREALFVGAQHAPQALRRYYDAMDAMNDAKIGNAIEQVEAANGWEFEARALTLASKMGVGHLPMDMMCDRLSGGERKRLALASALLRNPSVLLLDEPTNHIDTSTIEWLADYLAPSGVVKDCSVCVVTHDRYFLERVCTDIYELDRSEVYRYSGGSYARYLELRAERMVAEGNTVAAAKTRLRKESEWMARQPKARQAKSKQREEQYHELVRTAKGRGPDKGALDIAAVTTSERLGGIVLQCSDACVNVGGREILKNFNYEFERGERVGIVGPNGAGKTTFLRALLQQQPLESGTVRVGETVVFGFLDQRGLNVSEVQERQRLLKFVQEEVERGGSESSVSETQAMKLLSLFNFESAQWADQVHMLSGGERRRLQLLQVLTKNPNVLVLDEPTNDLDIHTIHTLEEYLMSTFQGCLLCVSHDRFFMDRVVDHVFVFEGNGNVRNFDGSYSEYLELARTQAEAAKPTAHSRTKYVQSEIKAVLSAEEKREYSNLNKDMEKIAKKIAALQKMIENSPNEPHWVLGDWAKETNALQHELTKKEDRWLELAEKVGVQ